MPAAARRRHARDGRGRDPEERSRGEGTLSPRAYVGVGANLGDASAQVRAAIAELAKWGPHRESSLWRTEPLAQRGPPAPQTQRAAPAPQPWYINAVVELHLPADSAPHSLLTRLHALERTFGRPAHRERWSPRTLDLDLLLFDDLTIASENLALPHPGLASRRFVLAPLAELAPDLVAPGQTRTIAALLADLDDPLRVEKL